MPSKTKNANNASNQSLPMLLNLFFFGLAAVEISQGVAVSQTAVCDEIGGSGGSREVGVEPPQYAVVVGNCVRHCLYVGLLLGDRHSLLLVLLKRR